MADSSIQQPLKLTDFCLPDLEPVREMQLPSGLATLRKRAAFVVIGCRKYCRG